LKQEIINIDLSDPQKTFIKDESRFKQLVAGRRFGKSYLIAIDIMIELLTGENKIILYLAPTYPMAKKTMYYYLVKLIPKNDIMKSNESDLTIYMKNGNIIYLAGSQNYDSHRGYPHLNKVYLDECAYQDYEVWQEIVRPAISNVQGSVWFVGTPNGAVNWFYDLSTNEHIKTFQYTTLDGGRVPNEEIELAKSQMDERTFRQEFLATFETLEGVVYYAYSEANHSDIKFNPNLTTYLCWDFNVNPMSCIIVQKDDNKYYAVKEFVLDNSNTELTAHYAKEYLENNLFSGKLLITGDATGQFRKSAATFTDYEIIRQIFKGMTGDPILKPTRAVKDRVNATNALFKNMLGEIRMFINISGCPRLHKDLQVTQWKQGGVTIDKQLGISDPSDALSYLAYNFEPIQPEIKRGTLC
jgi:phage terminase large subunit